MDIEQIVKRLIAEQLRIEESRVTLESDFKEDLGADSLDVVEIALCIEDELDLEIPDDDAGDITTVGDVVRLIERITKN